jgi:hypothetical protein
VTLLSESISLHYNVKSARVLADWERGAYSESELNGTATLGCAVLLPRLNKGAQPRVICYEDRSEIDLCLKFRYRR